MIEKGTENVNGCRWKLGSLKKLFAIQVFGISTFDMALRAPTSLLRAVNTPKKPLQHKNTSHY